MTGTMPPTRQDPVADVVTVATATANVVNSRDLLKGARTVLIEHAGQRYILRVTRENKLILTK